MDKMFFEGDVGLAASTNGKAQLMSINGITHWSILERLQKYSIHVVN